MTSANLDEELRRLAGVQHGVVSRSQASAIGGTDAHVRRRVASPAWELVTPRVLRMAGSPKTFEQRCMVAVLDAGHEAVVCRSGAARVWALPGFDEAAIEVTRLRRRARRATDPVPVTEPRLIPAHHRTVQRGVPVTTVERTLFDLAGSVHARRAERALDNALAGKLTTQSALRSIGEQLCRRGRTGSALFRQLLVHRGVDFRPVESGLEAAFLELLVSAGLPTPDSQVDLGGESWIGRVDFYFRGVRLEVEIDSERFHSAALDVAADRGRDDALRGAGFEVLRITEEEVRNRPVATIERVRRALAERKAA